MEVCHQNISAVSHVQDQSLQKKQKMWEEEWKRPFAVMNVGLIVFGERGLKASPQSARLR